MFQRPSFFLSLRWNLVEYNHLFFQTNEISSVPHTFFFTKWNLVSRIPSFFVSLKWNLVGYIHIFYLKLMKSRPFHIPFFHKMKSRCKMKSHPTKTQLFSIPQMKSRWLQLYIFSQTNEISSVIHAFFSCKMKSRCKMKSHPTKTQLFSISRMKSR